MFRRLKRNNAAARTALDWVCAQETLREILDAFTPQQLVVAAMLIDGCTLREIADELSDEHNSVTFQAVQARRRSGQERVARTMVHVNAEHLHGDVMSRRFWKKERRNRMMPICPDCGCPIHGRSIRCQSCAQIERRRREGKA